MLIGTGNWADSEIYRRIASEVEGFEAGFD
jgi:hypothetical protein